MPESLVDITKHITKCSYVVICLCIITLNLSDKSAHNDGLIGTTDACRLRDADAVWSVKYVSYFQDQNVHLCSPV